MTMDKKYEAKKIMFGTLAKGGAMQISQIVDYPEISIVDKKETGSSEWTRAIFYGEKEFKTVAEAIEYHDAVRGFVPPRS